MAYICVYNSPERYEEYHREYVEIPQRRSFYGLAIGNPEFNNTPLEYETIRLRRYRAGLHVSHDVFVPFCLNYRTSVVNDTNQTQTLLGLLVTVFHRVSEITDSHLRGEGQDAPEHTVILDKVEIAWQLETDRLQVDLVFYACEHRDVERGQRYFQDIIYRLLDQCRLQRIDAIPNGEITSNLQQLIQTSYAAGVTQEELERGLRFIGRLGQNNLEWTSNFTPPNKKYNKWKPEAEENALKLLESMLSKGQFEIYKKEGYVMVEGKSHKMYKVVKNSMIEVSEKAENNLYKTYRLCIEPKDNGTICPTDQVIAKIKLIQADEHKLHKLANKFNNTFQGTITNVRTFDRALYREEIGEL